jgi:hypothetical protein
MKPWCWVNPEGNRGKGKADGERVFEIIASSGLSAINL